MIEITNGTRRTTVTKGVFKEVYEPMGWKVYEPEETIEAPEKVKPVEPEEPEEVYEEYVEPEIEEPEDNEVRIPLSEMNLAELKAFAAENDIDISSARTKKDIRSIIKAEMEE